LQRKLEYELENDLRKEKHNHFLHPQLSLGLGFILVALGFLENSTFFTAYLFGAGWIIKKYTELVQIKKKPNFFFKFVSNHPKWYLVGGALAYLLFTSHGYTVNNVQGLTQLVASWFIG